MDNLYYIENVGCDAETVGLAIISDEHFPMFKQIIEDLNKNSYYACMPTISVYKINKDMIRPATDDDHDDIVMHLNGSKYTLIKRTWLYDDLRLEMKVI